MTTPQLDYLGNPLKEGDAVIYILTNSKVASFGETLIYLGAGTSDNMAKCNNLSSSGFVDRQFVVPLASIKVK